VWHRGRRRRRGGSGCAASAGDGAAGEGSGRWRRLHRRANGDGSEGEGGGGCGGGGFGCGTALALAAVRLRHDHRPFSTDWRVLVGGCVLCSHYGTATIRARVAMVRAYRHWLEAPVVGLVRALVVLERVGRGHVHRAWSRSSGELRSNTWQQTTRHALIGANTCDETRWPGVRQAGVASRRQARGARARAGPRREATRSWVVVVD
jgi:hypothetical protein